MQDALEVEADTLPNLPAGHASQASKELAPRSGLNVPSGQATQEASLVVPRAWRNVPAGQKLHVCEAPVEKDPASHTKQSADPLRPTFAPRVPGGQGMHWLSVRSPSR